MRKIQPGTGLHMSDHLPIGRDQRFPVFDSIWNASDCPALLQSQLWHHGS